MLNNHVETHNFQLAVVNSYGYTDAVSWYFCHNKNTFVCSNNTV